MSLLVVNYTKNALIRGRHDKLWRKIVQKHARLCFVREKIDKLEEGYEGMDLYQYTKPTLKGFAYKEDAPEDHPDIIVYEGQAGLIPDWFRGSIFVPVPLEDTKKKHSSGKHHVFEMFLYKRRTHPARLYKGKDSSRLIPLDEFHEATPSPMAVASPIEEKAEDPEPESETGIDEDVKLIEDSETVENSDTDNSDDDDDDDYIVPVPKKPRIAQQTPVTKIPSYLTSHQTLPDALPFEKPSKPIIKENPIPTQTHPSFPLSHWKVVPLEHSKHIRLKTRKNDKTVSFDICFEKIDEIEKTFEPLSYSTESLLSFEDLSQETFTSPDLESYMDYTDVSQPFTENSLSQVNLMDRFALLE